MPRRGENIYKRKDGRWEGRYIKEYDISNKAHYGYVYGKTYNEVKSKLKNTCIENAMYCESLHSVFKLLGSFRFPITNWELFEEIVK